MTTGYFGIYDLHSVHWETHAVRVKQVYRTFCLTCMPDPAQWLRDATPAAGPEFRCDRCFSPLAPAQRDLGRHAA